MSDYLILTLTDAGRLSMLDYLDSGFNISFSHVGLGSGNYEHSPQTEELTEKWADFPLIGGYVDQDNHCLVLTAMGQLSETKKVSELGVYDQKGTLFAVLAMSEGYIFQTESGGFFSFNISIVLDENVPNKKIKLTFSPQEQLLQALLSLHLQHKDPHPQYKQYIMAILRAHLSEFNPHDQYAMRSDVAAIIRSYIDQVRQLISLFTSLFNKPIYTGYTAAVTNNTISVADYKNSLKANTEAIFVNPEGAHEAWNIKRSENTFSVYIFSRSGTSRIGFNGALNWLVLSDGGESPLNTFTELAMLGVINSTGQIAVQAPSDKTINFDKAVILMTPEGAHEGWTINRVKDGFNANIYNRSGTNRVGYSGLVNYAVLEPNKGTDLTPPSVFPCLLMADVSEVGNFSINRPVGQTWDFTDPNIVVLVTPEGGHEAWDMTRQKDKIDINVYQRSGTNRVGYAGNVSWAIFMKEGDNDLYRAGTYEIIIPAKSKAEIHLVGAGGSGAGSLWSVNTAAEWLKMENGGDTSFTIEGQVELVAGGGQGGYRGVWNNGTDYKQGIAGKGGQVNIVKLGPAQIISKSDGEKAYLQTTIDTCNRDTRGGASRWKFGSGGAGGYTVETRKHRCYGAGGGSGAHIHFTYANDTTAAVKATLTVGENGVADWVSPELNNGKAGEAGCASVKIIAM
ncbi:hypothetical protein NNO96_09150 [Acinetobacter baumannii]|uniref:hypothetical protein n=1 Tax=Acinetobacter baumannii TaxID=470 RepID=UPI0020CF8DF2|nr:hypothetical protein [Acinetobacter baumannii]MCQ1072418.1 hypothetical protein [Acinetobacter baumannii]